MYKKYDTATINMETVVLKFYSFNSEVLFLWWATVSQGKKEVRFIFILFL